MSRIVKDDRGTLHRAEFGFAGENVFASPTGITVESGQCVSIANCDINDEREAMRRPGYTLKTATAITSGSGTYCVAAGKLSTFNGTAVTALTTDFTVNAGCEFLQVNDVTLFSDNVKIGIIKGATVTRIDKPSDWVDVATVETWVASHYPADPANWNGVTSNSNMEVDAYKLATLAGKCLEFYKGAVYLAIDNFIYRTKTFDAANMDIRYAVVAGFPSAVTHIAATDDGLFVGTTTGLYFLQGTGMWLDKDGNKQGGFSQRQISSHGVHYRSGVKVDGRFIQAVKSTAVVPVFASTAGVIAGLPGGAVVNLSQDKIDLDYMGETACAIFKSKDKLFQYVCCFSGGYTVVVNTNTADHSHYINYPFTSLFGLSGTYYGANATGIYTLTGEHDITAHIAAEILTPAPDFGSRKQKSTPMLYLHGSCSGNMVVTIIADEDEESEEVEFIFDGGTGSHCHREKGPKGFEGNNLQYRIRNVDGSDFRLSLLEAVLTERLRTR